MGVAAAAAAASVAAAGIAAGVSASNAEKQKQAIKDQQKSNLALADAAAEERAWISEQVRAEQQLATEQVRSAETARGIVMGMLGAPGTYGKGSVGEGEFAVNTQPKGLYGINAPTGLYGTRVIEGHTAGRPWQVEGTVDDPFATAKRITDQAQFSAVSSMVGQAVELGNREGELWDAMYDSTIGAVFDKAGHMQRQVAEEISRSIARGGTARRAGFAMALNIKAQEDINRTRVNELAAARVGLETSVNQIITSNLSFANDWVDNQAGIRDSYTNALASLRTYWSSIMPGILGGGVTNDLNSLLKSGDASLSQLVAAQGQKGQAIGGAVESVFGTLGSLAANYDSGSGADSTPADPYANQRSGAGLG